MPGTTFLNSCGEMSDRDQRLDHCDGLESGTIGLLACQRDMRCRPAPASGSFRTSRHSSISKAVPNTSNQQLEAKANLIVELKALPVLVELL